MRDEEKDRYSFVRVNDVAPDFEARTTHGLLRLSSFRGRWLIFFSHPADFTPVCTTEFVSLARAHSRFEALGISLLGLSIDSLYSHIAWLKAMKDIFGVDIPFPVVEDPSMIVGRAYGMIDANATDSSGIRSTYYIDPDGVVRAMTNYPMTVGRSVDEMYRLGAALIGVEGRETLAPADWTPGSKFLKPVTEVAQDCPDWFCRFEE